MDDLDDSMNEVLANMEIPDVQQPSTSKKDEITTGNIEKQAEKEIKYSNPNAVQVNSNQRGNPLLKSVVNVPWEYNDKIIPDYVVGKNACVLFLSIKYHNLKPEYIHERLKQLGKTYELRVLLVHVDIKESHNALKHLTRICLLADLTLMLAWSYEEAGRIVENYKLFENCSAERLMEKEDNDSYQKVINALTSIKSVNKTDAATILTNFGTLENLVKANESKLNSCIGLGPKKAQKLLELFKKPFLK